MKESKPLVIGLLGLGNVGSGVHDILIKNALLLEERTGRSIQLKSILVRKQSKERPMALHHIRLTTKASDILQDPEIDVVVEAMGGEQPALDYITQALKNKKHVVTANKEVISKHKDTLFRLAHKHQVGLYFEAAVGGGIPLIRSLKIGFAANKIESLYGILNGTTNFILTNMAEEGKSYETALKEAQALGFAEADPTMDVSGLDTAYKLDILAAVAFKAEIQVSNIFYEGINKISAKDLQYAKEFGYTIKLLALGKYQGKNHLILKVHPTMIPLSHPLATVRLELNALYIVGDAVGEAMLQGKGAGGSPTGSAIVSDIVDIAMQGYQHGMRQNTGHALKKVTLVPMDQTASQFYLRLSGSDKPGTLGKITQVLGQNKISISKVIQKEKNNNHAEIVIVTHLVKEKHMRQALKKLGGSQEIIKVKSVIRVGLEE